MGCVLKNPDQSSSPLPISTSNKHLKVYTLNFCGILKSPFQFYSGSSLEFSQNLSRIFKELMPSYLGEKSLQQFEKDIGSIDKKTKDYRYSPLYNIYAGVEDNKFISKSRFSQLWKENLEKHSLSPSDDVLKFDLMVYHSLLKQIYKIKQIDDALTLDTKEYLQTYTPLFNQSFLKQDRKIKLLKESIETNEVDILFLQEANSKLIEQLRQDGKFFIATSEDQDTMILAKKDSFKTLNDASLLRQKLEDKEWMQMNWKGHTSIMTVDQYILICGHLASKKTENEKNVQSLKKILPILRNKFPSHEIICGNDCNAYIDKFSDLFNVYPKTKDKFTTLKKRTWLQAQFSKGEKVIRQTKDHILTTLPIIEGHVLTIDGTEPTDKQYLPLDDHPYDHFLVQTILSRFQQH